MQLKPVYWHFIYKFIEILYCRRQWGTSVSSRVSKCKMSGVLWLGWLWRHPVWCTLLKCQNSTFASIAKSIHSRLLKVVSNDSPTQISYPHLIHFFAFA